MKKLLLLPLLVINLTAFSQSQAEMNQEAHNDYQKADAELNEVYQTILKEYQEESLFIEKLKAVQRIWITYRDAQLAMKYPYENKGGEYGDGYPACVSNYLQELTQIRTEQLRMWVQGVEEGDICSGSIKIN
ncbi:MAG: lysozyme inhibitor LprI family protein [Flavobacteriaceae bacterium]